MERETLKQLVADYDRYLVRRNRSPATRRTYRLALHDFLSYAEKHGVVTADELAAEHIQGWQDSLARRLKPSSRSLAASALSTFLKWAAQQGKPIQPNLYTALDTVHVPDRLPRPLPIEDVTKVLAYFASIDEPSPLDLRDRALFLCLLSTGARVNEVLQLTRRDVNRTSIVIQKGARPITMSLLKPVRDAISRYVETRQDDMPRLWVTMTPGITPRPLADSGVREIFRRVAKAADVPKFTTHQLRHTAATLLFEAKVPESLISQYLGHANLDAIRGYVDMRSRRREAMDTMERVLAMAEAPGTPMSSLDDLAARLDLVISSIEDGSLRSDGPDSDQIRIELQAAASRLRSLTRA
jgi:site-specific recombinase XerD